MRHLFYSGLAVPSICFIILTIQPQSLSFIHYVPMSTCEWPFNLTRMSMDCGRNRHDDTQTPQAVYLFIWLFVCLFVYSLRAQLYCGTLASVNNQIENDTFLNCLLILFPLPLILHTQKLFRIVCMEIGQLLSVYSKES